MRRFTRVFAGGLAGPALVLCQAWAQKVSTSPTSVPQALASNTRAGTQSPDSIQVRSSLVLAPVTVTDSSGNFIEDLRREQFHVWDDGIEQQITFFGLATEPIAAVIMVQTSKDMVSMLPEIHPLGDLLFELLLGKSGEAAVMIYADQAETIQSFSSNPETLARTLRALKANGKNVRLNDALARAIFMLSRQVRDKRRVIIVFSEGFDRGSVTTGAEVVRAASNANVTIYGIRFSPARTELKDDGRSALTQLYMDCPPVDRPCTFALNLTPLTALALKAGAKELRANLLGQYAGYTGGIVYMNSRGHAVQDQLQNIALAVNGQYDLAYVPTALKNIGFHGLKVTVSEPGLRVRTRAGYFYAAPRK